MENRFSELKFEFKEISEPKQSAWTCEIEINEDTFLVPFKSSISLKCLEITNSTVLGISLQKAEKAYGTLQVSFTALFGEGLHGKFDRWFRLKTGDGSKLQIRIFASLNIPEKLTRKSIKKSKSRVVQVKCPYLESNNREKIEALKSLWQKRSPPDSLIKLSLEADIQNMPTQELETLSFDEIKKSNGFQLKQTIKSLCRDIEKLENLSKLLPTVKQELEEKLKHRRNNEKDSQFELEEIKGKWMSEKLAGVQLLGQRKELKNQVFEKQESLKRLENEKDNLRAFLTDLKKEQILSALVNLQSEDCENSKNQLQGILATSQGNRKNLEFRIKQTEQDLKITQKADLKELENLKKNEEQILNQIKKIQEEYQQVQTQNNSLKSRLISLKLQISSSNAVVLDPYRDALVSQEKSRDFLNSKLASFAADLKAESNSISAKKSTLIDAKKNLSSEIFSLSQSASNKNEILSVQKSFFNEKISAEQTLSVRTDLHQGSASLSKLKDFYMGSQKQALFDLLAGSSKLSAETEKVLALAEQLENKIEAIDKKQEELESLKDKMGQIQKRHVFHVAVRNDPVDKALADFINTREVPVRFLKQDGGHYIFGSTRVYIKLENSKLLVKAKGGFTDIEDFLNSNLESEIKRNASPISEKIYQVVNRNFSDLKPGKRGKIKTVSRSPNRK